MRDDLCKQYAPMVRRVAHQLLLKLPAHVEADDLIQNGMLGLLDAIGKYREDDRAEFETYATHRVRGEMLDGLRDGDWMPRRLRVDMRRVEAATHKLQQKYGRKPSESELAEYLDLQLSEFQSIHAQVFEHTIVHFEDFDDQAEALLDRSLADLRYEPCGTLAARGEWQIIGEAIEALPARQRKVFDLYYEEDWKLLEIANLLGVSESRVCQIVAEIAKKIAAALKESELRLEDRKKPSDTKVCSRCNRELNLSKFQKSGAKSWRSKCRACTSLLVAERKAARAAAKQSKD